MTVVVVIWFAVSNSVVRLANRLLADQRIRYLIVGGINTVIGLGGFTLLELTISNYLGRFGYLFSLVASTAVAVCIAFVLHRKFVFRVRGKVWLDFGRFVLTNAAGFGINALVLPLLVEAVHLQPIIAQFITAVVVVILNYFGYKYFSFRRKAESH